ncbi:class I SAM-dependent methyltransferase [Lentzea sp. NEAU-D7]|uniref:class I SAM-dependent methyltransferase n=1 Tax=Lentzea sp. NEAU-D7 TaxID=2994667 RepID=UPI00224B5955|nr:class I SAM-dependent methyltransferase [Lentzea sp. NEAU-D7]MCX2952991.1 class I SAM-dependent methyltransferase [Lentzea sp. NEAU-D7]
MDMAPTAIEIARTRGEGVEWVVGSTFTGEFGTVLASASFHCLPPDERPGLLVALRDVVVLSGVDGVPELPVWVVEATAASRGAGAATTP